MLYFQNDYVTGIVYHERSVVNNYPSPAFQLISNLKLLAFDANFF